MNSIPVAPPPATEALPDAAARRRIATELDRNLLVEAGAGSGKTTELVTRMLALVRSGVPVESIAAVTFTRKAAAELSRRFRERLEAEALERAADAPTGVILDQALRDLDRGFVGTIHAFCARLLRERPLAARIDPRFTEVGALDEVRLQDEFWIRWLDRLHATEAPILARLQDVGLRSVELRKAFERVVELSDVEFPVARVERLPTAALHDRLVELVEQGRRLLPRQPLAAAKPDFQERLRRLLFLQRTTDWGRDADLFAALETLSVSGCKVTLKRWIAPTDDKREVRELEAAFKAFVSGPVADALRQWNEHRYGIALEFLLPLREAFREDRLGAATLTFNDLLMLAARLLREDADARGELGRRWPYLLVDEFQDTDPIQAEVCLLLASDPSEGHDWRAVRPRPGSLFVVGDPKQSIYRFRRADIEIYGTVRERIVASGGEVLGLTCNFRSVKSIGRFVDAAFGRLFPRSDTVEQAAFAPLNARRDDEPGTGVFRYRIEPDRGRKDVVGTADARAVSSWIARRIADGERNPGDFLVLPYRREALAFYARELERRSIPVVTTGAGLTVETELRELLVLLEALADPGNPVWTLAALSGLFFGVDPDELWLHAQQRRSLSFERGEFADDSRVEQALAKLREWFDLCRRWPIDSALARIVEEVGLVPMAAGGEMAESRAGSLVHALEVVGAGALQGATDLRSAIEAIEGLRESRDIEAPLRPGRTDAVRVMNLHKAKGLETPVVILAYPTGAEPREPRWHVRRRGPRAEGWFQVVERRNFQDRPRARPPGWDQYAAEEKVFEEAERARRLYVAVTRARDELVVAECERTQASSLWHDLHDEIQRLATPLDMPTTEPRARERPAETGADVRRQVEVVDRDRAAAGEPAYRVTSVTDEPETGEEDGASDSARLAFRGAGGRGRDWGTLVHRAIATMGRGRSGEALARYCRGLLLAAGRDVDERGEPCELVELLALLERVRGSAAWRELTLGGQARWELAMAQLDSPSGEAARLVTGTVDALGMGATWRLVDWKTDVVEPGEWEARRLHYERQVEAYRAIVRRHAGTEVQASVERVT